MKKICWIFLIACPCLFAYDATPRCFLQIESTFFEPRVVMIALQHYQVPRSSWNLIVRQLSLKSREIPNLMRARSRRLRPNPLKGPFNEEGAIRLLREVAHAIFRQTMQNVQAIEERSWSGIFSYIFDYQIEHIRQQFPLDDFLEVI